MVQVKQRRNELAIALIAGNIRKYRKAKGLTIEQLANLLEVDYSQISRMERGTVNFSVSLLFDLASILSVKPALLLDEE